MVGVTVAEHVQQDQEVYCLDVSYPSIMTSESITYVYCPGAQWENFERHLFTDITVSYHSSWLRWLRTILS